MDRASGWMRDHRLDEAATALAACEHAALQERDPTGHITASWQLGRACLKLRRPEEGLAAFRRCLSESWHHKRMAYGADALVQWPGGLAFTGQFEAAVGLQAFAAAHWQHSRRILCQACNDGASCAKLTQFGRHRRTFQSHPNVDSGTRVRSIAE